MADTIFTKIINREIPAEIVYENERCLAFKDISPKAPTHILVIPKKPIVNISSCENNDVETLGALFLAVRDIAKDLNLDSSGYRVVINNGAAAGQSVFHLHLHILAGRPFTWPPG